MSQPPTSAPPETGRDDRPLFRRIGLAALIVGAGVLLSRLLGLARDMVFASILGADQFTDEYVISFAIPDWINYLLAGGYLAITFIPILSRYLADGDEAGGNRAFSVIAKPVTLAMTVLVVLGMVFAEQIIDLIAPDFTADQVARATRLTRIVLPAQIFFVLGGLLTGYQYAKERFFIPTLAPIVYNLSIIAGGVLLNIGGDPSPEGFAWGVLIGALLGNVVLQWYGAYREGLRVQWGAGMKDPVLGEYLLLALPLMLGQSLVLLDEQLGRTFGTYTEDGGISWLQFARRTMLVPVGVIAQAAGVAAYPFLSRQYAEGKLREMAATVAKAMRYVIVLSLFAAAGLVALSIPIIRVLYERGEWATTDTVGAAGALVFFGLAVPFWGAQQILARGFYARREMWTPVLLGTGATLIAIPIYIVLLDALDVKGLALASTIGLAIYTLALAVVWYSRTGWDYLAPVLRSVLRALPLALLAAFAAWGVAELADRAVDEGSLLGSIAALAAAGLVFLAVVFLAGGALNDIRTARDPTPLSHIDGVGE